MRRKIAHKKVSPSPARIAIDWTKPDDEVSKAMGTIRRKTGFKGPSFYGCFNTGHETVLYRNVSKTVNRFFVGPDLYIQAARDHVLFGMNHTKRSYGEGRNKVWIFKTRKPAVQKFLELVREQLKINAEQRALHIEAQRKAQSNDPETRMEGMMALADF